MQFLKHRGSFYLDDGQSPRNKFYRLFFVIFFVMILFVTLIFIYA
jgi:hypothetical protein